jgi:SAM-dependent methyltransferase
MKLNFGCGRDIRQGYVNVDITALPGVDHVLIPGRPYPFADDTFDEIVMSHVVEHIAEPLPVMQELHRIAKPGAICKIACPYGSSDDAFEDPTHVRQYFKDSFHYFSQPVYWRADYLYRGDWQPERIVLLVKRDAIAGCKNETDLMDRVNRHRNVVQEMRAQLRAVKPIREPRRDLMTAPIIELVGA